MDGRKIEDKRTLCVLALTLAGMLAFIALNHGNLVIMWVLVDIGDRVEAVLALLWACLMMNAMGLCAHALGALFRHGWFPQKKGWRGVLGRVVNWVIRASGVTLQIVAIVIAALAASLDMPLWFAMVITMLHIALAAAGLYAARQIRTWLQSK